VQRAVLLKTREKLDALETAVRELEGRGAAE
jgi:BMFP domain-containing protein YqiC